MTTARFAQDPSFNLGNAQHLERLLGMVDQCRQNTKKPACTLCVEVDGSVIASNVEVSSDQPTSLTLPKWSRSLTLRDEGGSVRAHILLQEQVLNHTAYDRGRLLLSSETSIDGDVRLLIEQARIHIP